MTTPSPSYSVYDLGMNVSGRKFILPIDREVTDDAVMDQVAELFSEEAVYRRRAIHVDGNKYRIRVSALYEGYEEVYPFDLCGEVFRLDYEKGPWKSNLVYKSDRSRYIENGAWMIAILTEQEEGPLLEELVDRHVLPEVIEKTGLIDYTYQF